MAPSHSGWIGSPSGLVVENAIFSRSTGFHARVVQHECDHLAGILYPMRIRDLRLFGFNAELFPDQEFPDET